jgi:hypothetical protein
MTMKINKNFESLCIILLPPLEKGDDSLQLWKKMKGVNFFLAIPVPVEVVPLHASSIIPRKNAINVKHRYQNPANLVGRLHEPIDKSFHYPRSYALPWMLSSHYNY